MRHIPFESLLYRHGTKTFFLPQSTLANAGGFPRAVFITLAIPLLSLTLLASLLFRDISLARESHLEIGGSNTIDPSPPSISDGDAVKDTYTAVAALFGQPPESSEKPASIVPELSRLDLKLIGTFAHTGGSQGYALINTGDQTQSYQSGDEIRSGTSIHRIGSGYIVLERNGQYEYLQMSLLKQKDMAFESSGTEIPKVATTTSFDQERSPDINNRQLASDESLPAEDRLKALKNLSSISISP